MDYSNFVQPLLALFGGSLQWLRQYKVVGDKWIYVIAPLAAVGAYILTHVFGHDWRMETILALLFVGGNTSTVLGGTFAASGLAKTGLSVGDRAVIPMTDSK